MTNVRAKEQDTQAEKVKQLKIGDWFKHIRPEYLREDELKGIFIITDTCESGIYALNIFNAGQCYFYGLDKEVQIIAKVEINYEIN